MVLSAIPTTTVEAQGTACPSGPGNCSCNPASGVMTDHGMQEPYDRINNGFTSDS
jgi:hypothetical protein